MHNVCGNPVPTINTPLRDQITRARIRQSQLKPVLLLRTPQPSNHEVYGPPPPPPACVRWAATTDAIAASRISSAAFREGNKAARRWEAAGRCARHWRRVAAARGMKRRARGSSNPRSEVAAPRSLSNGKYPGDIGALSAAEGCVREGGADFIGGARGGAFAGIFGLGSPGGGGGRGGSRSRLLGDAAAAERCYFRSRGDAGGVGKENSGGDDGLFLRHSDYATAAAGGEPATRVAFRPPRSSPAYQENRTVEQADGTSAGPVAAVVDRRDCGSDAFQYGYENTETLANRPGSFLAQHQAARWAGVGPGASLKRSGLADSPAERGPSLPSPVSRHPLGASLSHTTRVRAAADYRRPRSIGVAAVSGGTATTRDREPSLPSFRGSGLDGASLEEGEEGQEPSTTTIAVSDLTQLPSPSVPAFPGVLSCGDREAGEAGAASGGAVAGAHSVGVPGGDGGDGGERRRPVPRRPLELLLDETARYSTASDGGQPRGGIAGGRGGGKGVAPPPPPLSTWVVDEMNRLFGVRNPGASELGAAFGGDRGHSGEMRRPVVVEGGRPTVRSRSRGQGLSWSAGAHAARETGDGGSRGHHHHPRRHRNTQLPRDEPLLRAATQQQENIPVAGGEVTWTNHASVLPPPPPHAVKPGEEHPPRYAQIGSTLGATFALPWSSPPPPPPPVAADARREGSRNAALVPATGRRTPTSAATLRQDTSAKDGEDGAREAEEGRRSERPPPPSADPPLLTGNLHVTGVSTSGSRATEASAAVSPASSVPQGAVPAPGHHETRVSASGAPAFSESQAARPVANVGVGRDAIVPRQSSVAHPESASLREERALEVSWPPAHWNAGFV